MKTIIFDRSLVKPSRAEALRDVRALLEQGSNGHLESLLMHFTAPPARRPAQSAAEWVARAVAVRDVRKYLEYMWVSPEGIAYGTDGHRAHFAHVEGFAPGFYDPKTLKPVEVSGRYPDVNRLMPQVWPDHSVPVSTLSRRVLLGVEDHKAIYEHGGAGVLQSYLNDAVNHAPDASVGIYPGVWAGVSEYGSFLVMGVRL